jgi:AbrB family looped-hinge helix DNA binding protein
VPLREAPIPKSLTSPKEPDSKVSMIFYIIFIAAIDKYLYLLYTCFILVKETMVRKPAFRFYATVSDRGQIFIPKKLQEYFNIKNRDKVAFIVRDDGGVIFSKKEGEER